MSNIFEYISIFNCDELNIEINDDVISFTKNKKTYKIQLIEKNKLYCKSYDNNLDNIHFSNILNLSGLNDYDSVPELIEFINNLNLNNYCIVCNIKLDFQSDYYVSCGDENCLYKYEEMIIGNYIIDKFKQDQDICIFLLNSAIDAIKCNRKFDIFEPFPSHFLIENNLIKRGTISKLEGKNYDNLKDFNRINLALDKLNINNLISLIDTCSTDIEIANIIGKDLCILIRFILMSCKVDIVKNDFIFNISSTKFKIYKINHPIDKEEEFNKLSKSETNYLFHGSQWANWYSILRNGLKNCSNTKLMTTGAALGNGIYLSSDINISFNYGLSVQQSVIGVFEVIDKQKYFKKKDIYVVDDEKDLIQRYLLIIPSKNRNSFCKEINNIFNTKIHEEKFNAKVKYNKKSIQKIFKEYDKLKKLNPINSIFRIEVDTDFPFLWKIFLSHLDNKYPITQDMINLNIKEIELEIRFPENYPFSPPFMRVVRPRFKQLTAHVISSGAFCLEVLTEKGWSPIISIESLVTIVISEIIEGNGRIDLKNYNIPYDYNEAKDGFIRVAKSHGWI